MAFIEPLVIPTIYEKSSPYLVLTRQSLEMILYNLTRLQLHMGLPGAALSISLSEWAAAAAYLAIGWTRRDQLGLGSETARSTGSREVFSDGSDTPIALRSYIAGEGSSLASYDAAVSSGFVAGASSSGSFTDYASDGRGEYSSRASGSKNAAREGSSGSFGDLMLTSLASYVPFLQVS